MTDKKSALALKTGAKTNPLLLEALKEVSAYGQATGARVCVIDENFMPIPEMLSEMTGGENTCLYCMKNLSRQNEIKDIGELGEHPCKDMHINAIKESYRFCGSYIYTCDLGFMFWTSPLFSNSRFIGSLLCSGFLGVDIKEPVATLMEMRSGEFNEKELLEHFSRFPRGEPEHIRALAELLLIIAESLSKESEDYHETLKRRSQQQALISEQLSILKNQYPPGGASPSYPLDKEKMLIAALRKGDEDAGRKLLNELLSILIFTNPDQFKSIQYRAIELVVLLSRAAVSPGNAEENILEVNNQYLMRIQETQSIEELTDVLHTILERMTGQIFSFQGIRHASALQKAEWFIWENYTRKISLQEIAGVSGLSAPYFSTVFKNEMGENLSSYLNRLRVEEASRLLTGTKMAISDIAGACGFEDQSWFSKIFKSFTGVSPGKFREQGGGTISEISEENFSEHYRGLFGK
ncbi:MAG: helix-turn-helix domain-containing protein [Spirochaetaceae bacterium]|jgi:AraC-like DNA-binding protein/ligand-binding sensor protein|nr:helix-turn-helix domain-containing protein [Spirochaetaceae bacterium]